MTGPFLRKIGHLITLCTFVRRKGPVHASALMRPTLDITHGLGSKTALCLERKATWAVKIFQF